MKYLINTVETYRVDTEKEADALISDAKNSSEFILSKYSSQLKEVKSKGEVVSEFYIVTLTKVFNDPKEPENHITVSYEREF